MPLRTTYVVCAPEYLTGCVRGAVQPAATTYIAPPSSSTLPAALSAPPARSDGAPDKPGDTEDALLSGGPQQASAFQALTCHPDSSAVQLLMQQQGLAAADLALRSLDADISSCCPGLITHAPISGPRAMPPHAARLHPRSDCNADGDALLELMHHALETARQGSNAPRAPPTARDTPPVCK